MKILIGTDGSKFSKRALEEACEIAGGRDELSFRVLSVYEPQVPLASEPYALSAEYFDRLDQVSRERAEEIVKDAGAFLRRKFPDSSVTIQTNVALGTPARMLVEAAEEWDADMIVVGSHGHGFWGRLALGSVSDAVIHQAPCSVLIAKAPLD